MKSEILSRFNFLLCKTNESRVMRWRSKGREDGSGKSVQHHLPSDCVGDGPSSAGRATKAIDRTHTLSSLVCDACPGEQKTGETSGVSAEGRVQVGRRTRSAPASLRPRMKATICSP